MTTKNLYPTQKPLTRDQYLQVIGAGLATKQNAFVRQAVLHWLATYPGDLQASLDYGRVLVSEGRLLQALPVLQGLSVADPEFIEAVELLLWVVEQLQDSPELDGPKKNLFSVELTHFRKKIAQLGALENSTRAQWFALVGRSRGKKTFASWGGQLWYARQALKKGDLNLAKTLLKEVLEQEPPHPLAAITHLELQARDATVSKEKKYETARVYHESWPDCLPCVLYLAVWSMECGHSDLAVALVHQAAARDVGGQVIKRLWGDRHPFRRLWADRLVLPLDTPVPVEVMKRLGWNRLTAGGAATAAQGENRDAEPAEVLPERQNPESFSGQKSPEQEEVDQPEKVASATVTVETLRDDLHHDDLHHDDLHHDDLQLEPAADEAVGSVPETSPVPVEPVVEAAKDQQPVTVDIPEIISRKLQTRQVTINAEIQAIEDEFENLAERLHLSGVTCQDGRFPVYVIFSARSRLQSVYGVKVAGLLEGEMELLAEAIRSRPGWGARVFFADDPSRNGPIGTKPAKADDPWGLKLALADLDQALAKRGERIGAVLIVGGPEIVPFHCLPNPLNDQDHDVPSDNPYATRDENFFIPEWPVGRLPGGAGADAHLLLDTLKRFQSAHSVYKRRISWKKKVQNWLVTQLSKLRSRGQRSFGYTAAIWKTAAGRVFQPIGKPDWLHVSPPAGVSPALTGSRTGVPKPVGRLGYFNLHGLVDAPEWFGHRDLLQSTDDEVDYPIAFRPQDVQGGSEKADVPKVIFSEACYGMHIQNRALDEAIALKFLEAGSQAIAGSTCMAYGSYGAIDNELVAADLLGHSFWRFLKDGMPAGEALRQAKIFLASEMDRRQGYLDGLDQKTLISFVLVWRSAGRPAAEGQNSEEASVTGSARWLRCTRCASE